MLLAIGTAHPLLSVALVEDGRVVAARAELVGRGHAERLVPLIAELMAGAGVDRADAVAADVGPGSYTGIRIGVAAARALALAWRVPARGLRGDALVAVAAFARDPGLERVAVVLDAARGELFVSVHARGAPPGPPSVCGPAEAGARARAAGAAAGDGLGALADPPAWCWEHQPDARDAALLRAAALGPPAPLYLRPPDARPFAP